MAKCEACDSEQSVEEVMDGSGMYHQLCEEHRKPALAPPAAAAAASPGDENPVHGPELPTELEKRVAILEERLAKLEAPPAAADPEPANPAPPAPAEPAPPA